jgi:hypothetical protein
MVFSPALFYSVFFVNILSSFAFVIFSVPDIPIVEKTTGFFKIWQWLSESFLVPDTVN